MPTIDILLATYNGARYLPELLESLERQTFEEWRLIVRDDGSGDASVSIVEAWAQGTGASLLIVRDDLGGLGAAASFGALLEVSDAPYFMFCDQDDVWLPNKMIRLLELMRQTEARRGGQPVLAHSDLVVVDAKLQPIHHSIRSYMRLAQASAGRPLQHLMVQNVVVGCASIGNASLRRAALPISKDCMMHDWWLALVAAAFGEIAELREPTVLYRQHGQNVLGARALGLWTALARFLSSPGESLDRTYSLLERTQCQARAFADRYASRLPPETAAVLHGYGHLSQRPLLARKLFMVRNRIWGGNPITAATFLALA